MTPARITCLACGARGLSWWRCTHCGATLAGQLVSVLWWFGVPLTVVVVLNVVRR